MKPILKDNLAGEAAAASNENATKAAASALENVNSEALPSSVSDQREIYLGYTCFESSRAHWFLYIPSLSKTSSLSLTPMGKVIQVTGNPFTGFGFQVKLNHNAAQQPDTHYLSLGSVPANAIIDDYKPDPLSGPELRDRPVPGDRLEQIAYDLGLPYQDPSATLPPPGDPVWLKPHPKFERCQEWMRKLVRRYVEEKLLPSSALAVLDEAISVGL